ncbi:MAG: response regulator [Chloroflexota bacterium]
MTTVLVIEDEAHLRENIVSILTFEGFDTLAAADGVIGIDLARKQIPDLILCDIMMPHLDGYGVLVALRSEPVTSMIPIIFLTAKAGRDDFRYGMALGADDYVTKPFTPDELLDTIATRLERQRLLEQEYRHIMETMRLAAGLALPPDLQALLNSVLGNAGRLMVDAPELAPDQIEALAGAILEATHNLHRRIENYLLFAQLEIIRMDPARIIVLRNNRFQWPGALIEQTAREEAARYGREADVEVTAADVPVSVTRENLAKIAQELVDNALKFSAAGTPVQVTGCVEGDAYALHVTDCGGGIAEETVHYVMNPPDFRTKTITLHNHPGLGLIIVQHLVQAHKGHLTLTSIPGQGTHVCAALPLHKGSSEP